MPEVIVRKGEPVDRALKRLKNKLDAEGILEEVRPGVFGHRFINLKVAMCCCAARVNHALRDSLVIEMGHLFAKDEILDQGWTTIACFE